MTIGQDLERRLHSWMQEDALLPDDLREVLAKLPETPQRAHPWPTTLADVIWRTRTMFTATQVAAAVMIFTLGAGFALLAAPVGDSETSPTVPAAEAPSLDDMSRFTSHSFVTAEYPAGTMTANEFGEKLEGIIMEHGIEASDPRLTGTVTGTYNAQYLGSDSIDYPALVISGTRVVENEAGTWEGTFHGVDYPGTPDFEGQSLLVGTGAYEGLVAMVSHHGNKDEGLIFPGTMPPLP